MKTKTAKAAAIFLEISNRRKYVETSSFYSPNKQCSEHPTVSILLQAVYIMAIKGTSFPNLYANKITY